MSTIVLGITDTHWTEKKPRSRKDVDFKATQTRKLRDLFKLTKQIRLQTLDGITEGASAIVHGGDLFHQPDGAVVSRELETWLIPIIRETPKTIFTIPGNHDMKGHRLEALKNHPYGVLLADDLITQVIYPTIAQVGEDPLVLITGKEFTSQGPKPWLDMLRQTKALIKVKEEIEQRTQKKPQVLALTHGWWGPVDTVNRGEPVTAYENIKNTGIDVWLWGHPHTLDGVITIQDDYGQPQGVGPGAFIRGSLAEHDVKRQPMIAIMVFEKNGTHSVKLVPVPHESSDQVFDLEKHTQVRKTRDIEAQFIKQLTEMNLNQQTLAEIMKEAEGKGTPERVIILARQYLVRAEVKK